MCVSCKSTVVWFGYCCDVCGFGFRDRFLFVDVLLCCWVGLGPSGVQIVPLFVVYLVVYVVDVTFPLLLGLLMVFGFLGMCLYFGVGLPLSSFL